MSEPIKRSGEEFAAATQALVEATTAYRKAASLAYREGARVVGTFGEALTSGLPLDAGTVVADCEGAATLGRRAQAAEIALNSATVRFAAACADLAGHMKGA